MPLSGTKSQHLVCPITQEVFVDPVVAAGTLTSQLQLLVLFQSLDGHTYERSAILDWFLKGKRTSPVTNLPLPNTILIPNTCVRSITQNLK